MCGREEVGWAAAVMVGGWWVLQAAAVKLVGAPEACRDMRADTRSRVIVAEHGDCSTKGLARDMLVTASAAFTWTPFPAWVDQVRIE